MADEIKIEHRQSGEVDRRHCQTADCYDLLLKIIGTKMSSGMVITLISALGTVGLIMIGGLSAVGVMFDQKHERDIGVIRDTFTAHSKAENLNQQEIMDTLRSITGKTVKFHEAVIEKSQPTAGPHESDGTPSLPFGIKRK